MTKDWGEHTAVPLRPVAWWQAQAAKVTGGRCLKCRGVTDGVYVPPTRETELECAVAEHCRTCGWETVLVRGRAGEVEAVHARPEGVLKRVGVGARLPGAPQQPPRGRRRGKGTRDA